MDGIINIYKEKGFTSHDVVAKARGILRQKKIGHTGTLDPDATGVLPICIGEATKIVPYLSDANKTYEAEVILGAYTTTEDASGEVVEEFAVEVSNEQVLDVLARFVGAYEQTPPMYSAIKINGQRLYELARQNIVIDRPSRMVEILELEQMSPLKDGRFKIRVVCSKGTYVRTLCTDIGRKLKCGAHMGELTRTRVGEFDIEQSVTLKQLEKLNAEEILISIEKMFEQYPAVVVDKSYNKFLYNGNPLELKIAAAGLFFRVYDYMNHFIGLYKWSGEKLIVEKMFYKEGK
ncbi:tRNA pseudouridine(55) synthase TruB [Candidatus Epulonipiscium viviparus]|uniref:tRNA pseudouridine(55) synthase TruB n=1 Tax=Candidatus Epulonipiscium viviparus TaxID=420336 RepID=UPI0027381328|nr:tRNA pseudouridine(55) synthase TruB [Candidatus Epulopiscium viviparus]